MIVLGIETSTAVCATGLFIEGKPEVERSLIESHIHSEKLLTLIQEVVTHAGVTLNDIHSIAVSIGPGSFTGLRIGLSAAKGLCFALDRPLVVVPTFEAIAEAAWQLNRSASRIVVMIDAKKDEFYFGDFTVAASGVEMARPVTVLPFDRAVNGAGWDRTTVVVTDKVEWVRKKAGGAAQVLDVHLFCRGSVVARLGYRKTLSKEFADGVSVEPVYLKDFVVRTAPIP